MLFLFCKSMYVYKYITFANIGMNNASVHTANARAQYSLFV